MREKIVYYTSLLLILATVWKCATITSPQGGPKDEIPPTLLSSKPKQNEKNYKAKVVELTFDEAIKLKDPKEEIIIIPSPGKDIDIKVKSNTVTIEPKNGWKDSTTYSLTFREGIQDLSEGNPVPDLRLAFSTGPIIDSLIIKGKIKDALSEKIPEKITVALYNIDTFNLFKHTPSYFTKTDKDGNFKIENLKPDKYLIYAFDDKNKNLKVDTPGEIFGYLADTLYLVKNVDGLIIPLIKIDTRKLKLTSGRSIQELATIKFNKAITSYQITDDSTHHKFRSSYGDNQTEISLWINEKVKDSVKIRVQAEDSLLQKVDTSFFIKRTPTKRQPEAFKINFTDTELDSITAELRTTFTTNKIITQFNYDSIYFQLDSTEIVCFQENEISFDTIFKKGYLKKKIDIKRFVPSKKNPPKLKLGKDFACSIENDSIKGQDLPIKFLTMEETGTLSIETKNANNYDVILQLIGQNGKVVRSVTNPKKYTFKNIPPSTYKIKIIHDANCNAKWDYGNIFLHEEPETVEYFKTIDGKYEIPIRANWEVGPLAINIPIPQGKPKDEKPPFLIKSNPKQGETNFSGHLVELSFDEPIKLTDPYGQLTITPSVGKNIKINESNNSLTIEPSEGWKPSTTYHIYLRNGIQDLKGGNTSPNPNLTFSTGPFIDSLSITGSISYATSEKTPTNVTVAIYTSDKFNIFRDHPDYFAYSAPNGKFKLSNLKAGQYFIYAFEDKNSNLTPDSPHESIGFLSKPLNLTTNITGVSIVLSKIDSRPIELVSQTTTGDLTTLQLNKSLTSYSIRLDNNQKIQSSFGDRQSEIKIYSNGKINRNTQLKLTGKDSLLQRIDTTILIPLNNTERRQEPLKIIVNTIQLDSTTGEFKALFRPNKLINYINYDRIQLRVGNQFIPFERTDILMDTLLKSITLLKLIDQHKAVITKKTPTFLYLGKDALCSVDNDSVKSQRLPVKIITRKETGKLQIEVTNRSNLNYIVQLLTRDNKPFRSIQNPDKYTFENLPSNKYKINIIIDQNNNGIWDYGNILLREEPEKIIHFKTKENKFELEIKPNNQPETYQITL
jgi:uncharacterized protein (DUF2141 family)